MTSAATASADRTSEDAIRSLHQQLLAAWNRRDAGAFAALFAGDGYVIGFDGSQMEGREQIAVFQNTPAQFHGRPELVERMTAELRKLL